jgi:uncharacterized tellurite resistance protein B-like protein
MNVTLLFPLFLSARSLPWSQPATASFIGLTKILLSDHSSSVHLRFIEVSEGGKHPTHFEQNDYRLAAAALFVHTAAIDGNISDRERAKLHAVIKRQFDLDEATTDELVAEATEAEHDAIDLYHFTSLINRSLDEAGRRRVVEMMWEIIYADGRVTEFESNLMWRAADLLGISARERIELGQQVANRRGTDPS